MFVSVIMPVYNEGPGVAMALKTLKESAPKEAFEVIVVDGKSTDNTKFSAGPWADLVISSNKPGRANQMHEGAQKAKGDLLLFLHSDTFLPENWHQILKSAWGEPTKPSATAFRLKFDKCSPFYRLMERMNHWRTRWLTGVPHGDQGIAIDKQTYFSVGGFPDVPLMEEYELMKKLRKKGKLKLLKEAATTSCRRYEKNGPIRNNIRNLTIITLFYFRVPPKKLAKLYK